jgi:hypothetical protein
MGEGGTGIHSPFEGGKGDVILNQEPETIFTSDFCLRTSVFFNIVTNNKFDI